MKRFIEVSLAILFSIFLLLQYLPGTFILQPRSVFAAPSEDGKELIATVQLHSNWPGLVSQRVYLEKLNVDTGVFDHVFNLDKRDLVVTFRENKQQVLRLEACPNLTTGVYRFVVYWSFQPSGFSSRELHQVSNPFTITRDLTNGESTVIRPPCRTSSPESAAR
jgi:hypothetical protein